MLFSVLMKEQPTTGKILKLFENESKTKIEIV